MVQFDFRLVESGAMMLRMTALWFATVLTAILFGSITIWLLIALRGSTPRERASLIRATAELVTSTLAGFSDSACNVIRAALGSLDKRLTKRNEPSSEIPTKSAHPSSRLLDTQRTGDDDASDGDPLLQKQEPPAPSAN